MAKKLLLGLIMFAIMASGAWGARTSTLTILEKRAPSYTKAWVKVLLSDSTNIRKIFVYSQPAGGTTVIDSSLGPVLSDSISFTNLRNGITYKVWAVAKDTTGNVATDIKSDIITFTTQDYCPTVSIIADSGGYTGFWVKIDTTGAKRDSLWSKIVLQYGTTEANRSTRWDSITTVTVPDTIKVDSLKDGATYYYRVITTFKDSNTTNCMDTTAWATTTVKDSYPLVTKIYASNDTFVVGFDTITGHTMQGLLRVYLWLNTSFDNSSRCWTKFTADSIMDSSYHVADSLWDDTLNTYANPIYVTGKYGLWWRYRFIYVCSLGVNNKITDTTATDSVWIAPYAFMGMRDKETDDAYTRRFTWFIDKTSDAPATDYIPIAGYKRLRITMKLTGQRDATIAGSGTADTIVVTLGRAGLTGDVIVDTLIPKTVLDTSALITKSYDISDTAQWYTDYAKIWTKVADTAVAAYADSTLNRRRIDGFIELTK